MSETNYAALMFYEYVQSLHRKEIVVLTKLMRLQTINILT